MSARKKKSKRLSAEIDSQINALDEAASVLHEMCIDLRRAKYQTEGDEHEDDYLDDSYDGEEDECRCDDDFEDDDEDES